MSEFEPLLYDLFYYHTDGFRMAFSKDFFSEYHLRMRRCFGDQFELFRLKTPMRKRPSITPSLFSVEEPCMHSMLDCLTGCVKSPHHLHDICINALYDDSVASWIWFLKQKPGNRALSDEDDVRDNGYVAAVMVGLVSEGCLHIEHLYMATWVSVERGFWLALLLALDQNNLMAVLQTTHHSIEEPYRDWPLLAAAFLWDTNTHSLVRPVMLADGQKLLTYIKQGITLAINITKRKLEPEPRSKRMEV
jgi:hypothetical protein